MHTYIYIYMYIQLPAANPATALSRGRVEVPGNCDLGPATNDLRPGTRGVSYSACRALHFQSKKEGGTLSIFFFWAFLLAKELQRRERKIHPKGVENKSIFDFWGPFGVILGSFWGRGRTLDPFGRPWGPGWGKREKKSGTSPPKPPQNGAQNRSKA